MTKNIFILSFALLALGCGKSTDDWIGQLQAGDVPLRREAVRVLGERKGEAAQIVPALVQALRDENAYVRRDAALALAKVGPDAGPAVPALRALLHDKTRRVRQAAAAALKAIAPATTVRLAHRPD